MRETMPQSTYRRMDWTSDRISRFWEYEAQFPERYFTFTKGEKMVALLEPFFGESQRILDFACGTGNLMGHLINQGYKVAGVDFSELAVSTVRAKFESSPLFLGAFTLEELQKPTQPYGTIFACEIIEHLNDSDLQSAAAQLHELADKDTNLIITTPNAERLEDSDVYCPACDHVFHRWQHVRSWSPESLKSFLGEHGFRATKVFATNFSKKREEKESAYLAWKSLRKRRKKIRQGRTSGPHLVAIARPM